MVLEMAGKTDPDLFLAGAGRAVITPPVGFVIDGPEHGARTSTGVLDVTVARPGAPTVRFTALPE